MNLIAMLLGAALIVGANATMAQAGVILSSPQVAKEVDGLVVNGVTYDVTFGQTGVSDNTFVGNAAGALTAVKELEAALNATTAAFVLEPGVGAINQFIVQDGAVGAGIGTSSFFTAGNWQTLGATTGDFSTAFFTVETAVPEPGSLALLAVGLAPLWPLRRRRRRKAPAR
jgi:hypothetical protein